MDYRVVGKRIPMQHSSSYSPSATFCAPSLASQAIDFPTPCTISQRHASAVSTEGGRMFVVLPAEPHTAACINQSAHAWKVQFCKITAYNHSWNSRSSVIQTESQSEVDYTRDGDWLYFRIGGISYSVGSIRHPQAIMRITGFFLQAAHLLLSQTRFLQLPSWSPETIQTPEGCKN